MELWLLDMRKKFAFIFFCSIFFFLILVKSNSVNAISGLETISLSPIGDSQIDYENKDQNYGRLPYFSTRAYYTYTDLGWTGMEVHTVEDIKTVLRFDLSSIPQGSYIKNAYLKLYAYNVSTDAPCELHLSRITGDWDERWITANNAPHATLMSQYHYTVRGRGFLKSDAVGAGWQISDLAKKWFSGEYRNYGIIIDNRSGKNDSLCKFYSKNETVAANAIKKPGLIIDYLPPLTVSLALAPENQITSTTANVYWTSNIPVISVIYYKKGSTGNWVAKMNNDGLTSDRIILNNLVPNTRYYYKVYVRDEINRDKTTAESSFITKASAATAIDPNSLSRLGPSLGVLRTLISITPTPTLTLTPTPTTTPLQNEPDPADIDEQNQNNFIKIVDFSNEITEMGGTFSWITKEEDGSEIMADIKTSGFVYVSKDSEPTKSIHDFDFGKNQAEVNHTVLLKYLNPGTKYYYLVYSESDAGQTGTIKGSFTTKTIVAEENSNPDSSTNSDQQTDEQIKNSQNIDPSESITQNPDQTEQAKEQNPLSSPVLSNKLNIPLIILIGLIIIFIILFLTKKNKNDQKNSLKEEVKDVQKTTVKADSKETSLKKGKGCLIVILVIVGFIVLSTIGSMASMFLSPGMIPMLLEVAQEKISQSFSGIKNQSAGKNYKEAQTINSFAKIDGNTNLSFSAVDKTEWPKDTIGGLYKIEPSGNFSKLSSITIDIKDNVQKGFALGYYHPDTKKWEYIPTIRIFGNTYKALISHASEVGGYAPGLAGALEYEPHFKSAELQATWESLKTDLEKIARDQVSGFDTTIPMQMAEAKLDRIATWVLDICATNKTFDSQMDYFFIWHIAQLIKSTKVDERMGTSMSRCVDMQATRTESRYDYMIRETKELKNDLNIPTLMQLVFKGNIKHEGYPLVSGFGNTDWRTDWQVIARTEYKADVQYHWSMNFDLPTPEGTWGNGIVTHILLFSLKNIREGQTFKIRGVSIGDAPGYYRNWHEDFKWQINHPSTVEQPIPSDPNKHVLDMTGTLVKDNGKAGAIIKYGGLSKEQQSQMDAAMAMIKNSGMSEFQGIPAYFQELAPEMTLNIIKGNPYNE